MKPLVVMLLTISMFKTASSQTGFGDTASVWFEELKQATRQQISLWKYDLYAPVLMVDPNSRRVFANFADSTGTLQPEGSIYTGFLPETINMANTALEWAGQHWAMVILPLPSSKTQRIQLLAHELFHRAQKHLGFTISNSDNNHLDKKDGRIYLRLELEALKKAVLAPTRAELLQHISHAIFFRTERYAAYPGAGDAENTLELNEGISEFTGFMISGKEGYEARKYFAGRITSFMNSNSYTRSFSYETVPVYGFLLNAGKKGWNREITPTTNLTEFFSTAFGTRLPGQRKNIISTIGRDYGYAQILADETAREEKYLQQFNAYRVMFIDAAHIEIPLIKMSMSFDYTRQFSMDSLGMVYPSIRITDDWGILEASQGALINVGWSQVNISYPLSFDQNKITGEGWTLELTEGFLLEKNEETGVYSVKKTGN